MNSGGAAKKRKGLGRGLGALISAKPVAVTPEAVEESPKRDSVVPISKKRGEDSSSIGGEVKAFQDPHSERDEYARGQAEAGVRFIAIEEVAPNPEQPRKIFSKEQVAELVESIKSLGVLQPILVRAVSDQKEPFQIVAGERRWRAANGAGLKQIPVIIKDFDDKECLEVALVENIQRSDLTPLEEARGYDELMKRFSLTQADVAERVGKDRATIANAVRLLKLPLEVQAFVESKALSVGHAKAILTVKEPKLRIALAHKVVKERLTVRDLERIVARTVDLKNSGKKAPKGGAPSGKYVHGEIAQELQDALGTKVRIAEQPNGRGKVVIEYFSGEELERIVDIICE